MTTPEKLDAAEYERRVGQMADALHEDCRLEWQAIAVVDPTHMVTQHGPDAHYGRAHDLVRRLTVADIEAEARVGYVPASLSPEWHAELALVEAESRNATLDEVLRVVEGLSRTYGGMTAAYGRGMAVLSFRSAVLDAVMALRS